MSDCAMTSKERSLAFNHNIPRQQWTSINPFFILPAFNQFFPLLLLVLTPFLLPVTHGEDARIIPTSSGKIKGKVVEVVSIDGRVTTKVEAYLGIPYAEPPIGKLRFARSEPIKPWTDTKLTQDFGPTCWQWLAGERDKQNPAARMWINTTAMNENCLQINVWAPYSRSSNSKKAMLIWVYGGGFVTGSANLEVYNGGILSATEDIVVANMQYRVGPFGFLYLKPGTKSDSFGNFGLWDQNLAISWLYRNAPAFGVDQNRITLMGESAGAVSVSMHLLSPHSHRYFSRAIMHSGSFLGPWTLTSPELAHRRAINLAVAIGCLSTSERKDAYTSTKYSARIVDCLRRIDPKKFIDLYGLEGEDIIRREALRRLPKYREELRYPPFNLIQAMSFGPVMERSFFPISPEEAKSRKTLKKVPLLLGTNKNEGSYFIIYYMPPFHASTQALGNLTSTLLSDRVEPAVYIKNYILPLHLLYPSVLDAVLLAYKVPSSQLFPSYLQTKNVSHWLEILEDIIGDLNFKCCTLALAEWYSELLRQDVYVYNFEYRSSKLTSFGRFPEWTGAMHGYELDYVFGMPHNKRFVRKFYPYLKNETVLSTKMMERWGNFIKTGNPNKDQNGRSVTGPNWPPYKAPFNKVLRLRDENLFVGVTDKKVHCALWNRVVPRLASKLANSTCQSAVNEASGLKAQLFPPMMAAFGIWMFLTRFSSASIAQEWLLS